jgi:hypothetical protein
MTTKLAALAALAGKSNTASLSQAREFPKKAVIALTFCYDLLEMVSNNPPGNSEQEP